MNEEQKKEALEALDILADQANKCRYVYAPDISALRTRVLEALQSPPVPVIEGLEEAIVVLSEHNKWRRGEHPYDGDHPQPMEITPKQLGLAIECVLKASSAYAKLQKEVNK